MALITNYNFLVAIVNENLVPYMNNATLGTNGPPFKKCNELGFSSEVSGSTRPYYVGTWVSACSTALAGCC